MKLDKIRTKAFLTSNSKQRSRLRELDAEEPGRGWLQEDLPAPGRTRELAGHERVNADVDVQVAHPAPPEVLPGELCAR